MLGSAVLLPVLGGGIMIEIRKLAGKNGWFITTIPPKYIRALGWHLGDYIELYLVDKLTVVMKKHNTKAPYGLRTAAAKPPIDV